MTKFSGISHEAMPDDDQDEDEKTTRKRNWRLSSFASVEADRRGETKAEVRADKPVTTTVVEALAAKLATAQQKRTEIQEATKEKPEEAEKKTLPEADTLPGTIDMTAYEQALAAMDDTEEADENSDEDAEVYIPLENQELLKDTRYAGEVIYLKETVTDKIVEIDLNPKPVMAEAEPLQPAPGEVPSASESAPEAPAAPAAEATPEPTPDAGGGGGEVPPTDTHESGAPFEEPPEEPRPDTSHEAAATAWPTAEEEPEPAQVYREYMQREATERAATVRPAEKPVTKQELENAVYDATRDGQNRGLLAGLVAGGWYEHRKHKRREKRAEKRFQTQSKQLVAARQSYTAGLEEHARQQAESGRQLVAAQDQLKSTERRFANHERTAAESRIAYGHERAAAQPNPERPPLLQPEHSAAALAGTPEQLAIPAEHRLEASAWHSIEVDAKTGKPVENPAFQYGHEYYRERAQEATPTYQRNAATGEVALVAAAGANQPDRPDQPGSPAPGGASPVLPSSQIPSATTQGPPAARQSSTPAQAPGSSPAQSDAPTTRLWPWLLALAVVVICLIAVLA